MPNLLHNDPQQIPPAVLTRIRDTRENYQRLIVVNGDCGAAGALEDMLENEGVRRVPGPHCYEMYVDGTFEKLMVEDPGTSFMTDYLVASFDHLVLEGIGLDRHPKLRDDYFKNYTRIVYLTQHENMHWKEEPDRWQRVSVYTSRFDIPVLVYSRNACWNF